MKRCSKCKESKPHSDFYLRDGKPRGWCKTCHTAYYRDRYRDDPQRTAELLAYRRKWGKDPDNQRKRRAKAYGMTVEQYDQKVADQRGRCAICDGELPLQVDHDHTCCATEASSCGKCNRGLLCTSCNVGISRFGDDPNLLIAAAEYLSEWRAHV